MAAMFFVGCNSNTYQPGEDTASSVAVASFSLSKNDEVIENLDTVFFSIDLNTAQIYNADSLPYGTVVDKLVPVIKLVGLASKAELKSINEDGTETIHDYLANQNDSVNFANGPVYFTVASPNDEVEYTYTIKVNVHKVVSDSLVWGETARAALPTSFDAPFAQHTVKINNTTYCLSTDRSAYSIAKREGAEGEWEMYSVTLPTDAAITEFSSTDEALYIIAGGKIFTSADEGRSWADTGVDAGHIYGGYGNTVLYSVNREGAWFTGVYPGDNIQPMAPDMPVTGTSQLVNFSYPLASSVVATMVGGRDADDKCCNATWGFDGSTWAKISTNPINEAYEGMTLVPFFVFTVSSVFEVTRYSVLLAFGGQNDVDMNSTVYISGDCGRTWRVAGSLLQLPDYFPEVQDAQAFVETLTMGSRSASEWIDFPVNYRLPATAKVLPPFMPLSRATEPVTTWECPYIYFYGGMTANGSLSPYLWRGTINRMTFKPII